MRETWKRWMEKKGIEKWFQRDNLIILVLSGVLLFIIALPTKSGTASGADAKNGTGSAAKSESGLWEETGIGDSAASFGQSVSGDDKAAWNGTVSGEDYCAYLEQRLKETLSGMSGVGSVQVMITLKSSEELVVEKDSPVSRSNTNEQDYQGGSRITTQVDSSETTVYRTQGSDSEPYVVKTILPEVEGVVVVAEGAGSGTVNKSITEIVQALFNVEAHKVKVVKMQTTN